MTEGRGPTAGDRSIPEVAKVVAQGLFGGSRRIIQTRPGHAYLAVRGLAGPQADRMAAALERELNRLEGVKWASVNPVLASVVVSFDGGRTDVGRVADVIGSLEEAYGAGAHAGVVADHPADTAPAGRTIAVLAGDVLALGFSAVGRLTRLPPLPVEAASVLTAVEGVGPLRRALGTHPRAATGAALASAALQGLGQGPVGLAVDMAYRASILSERLARRQAWMRVEPQVCGGRPEVALAPQPVDDRPVALPQTLAERYAQTSSLVSLAGAAVSLGLTRNPRRAADLLLAGLPRAARLGVESFASQLDRIFAGRNVIVMDPQVLRQLDLVDTVVVDAPVLGDPAAPNGKASLDPHAAALIEAVRTAAQDLVIAGKSSPWAAHLAPDLTVAGGRALARSVRELQAEGRVVALVSGRPGSALMSADCGIGIVHAQEQHPPWGADLICMALADAPAVIDATRLARTAGREASVISAAGSLAGSLLALGPLPGAGRRAVTAVQVATLVAMGAGAWTATKLPPRPGPALTAGGGAEEIEGRPWHALEATAALTELGSSGAGLTPDEATARYRPDTTGAKPGFAALFARELSNPLTAVLGAGAALSAATGSVVDAALIGGVIGMDALIGAGQKLRTEAAITRLTRALTEGRTTVVRAGREVVVEAGSIVPGDVVHLSAGDAVPADCRVLDAAGLEVDESSLTGESFPVAKEAAPVAEETPVADRPSMLYAGTAVAAGRAAAVVVATGEHTESRRGAAGAVTPATGVQTRLKTLTDRTIPVVVGAGAALTFNSLLRGAPAREAVSAGVSLATSAVPEGLPFVATVAQAAAARRLAASGILVRNPEVLEALGRVEVLCFDKTGTLTEGHLRLTRVSDGVSEQAVDSLDDPSRAVLAAALRATPRARPGGLPHPTDQAVVEAADQAQVAIGFGAPGWRKVGSLPFEPGRGYHAVAAGSRAGQRLSVKGAPEVVLPRCTTWRRGNGEPVSLNGSTRHQVEAEVHRLAGQGLRVLAVAERNGSGRVELNDDKIDRLELLGFVAVADDARASAAGPLSQLQDAGIHVVMITGDHPATAEAVGRKLGLINGGQVMTGPQVDAMTDKELDAIVDRAAVFARVTPAHKVRIVAAYQRGGRAVAMTGDGANDAQAIRLADVGVAFGSRSTPAAQDAADIWIARDDLDGLTETMVEARAMWASVRESLAILLGGNLGEVLFATGGALIDGRPPLTPRQLLTVNLFTDLAPAMAIAVQPPRSARFRIRIEGPETSLSGRLARDVALRAGATSAGAYGAWVAARVTGTRARARTVALAALVLSQLGQTMVIGRRSKLVLGTSIVSGAGLAAIIQTPGVSQFFGCRPLGPFGWGIALYSAGAATVGAVAADWLLP
jgi:cation-transporting ATPase I